MKIPGDNSKPNKPLIDNDNTAKKLAEETSSKAKETGTDAVKTSLGRILSEGELAERRERIEFLKSQVENGTYNPDSRSVATSIEKIISEEILTEQQLAENS